MSEFDLPIGGSKYTIGKARCWGRGQLWDTNSGYYGCTNYADWERLNGLCSTCYREILGPEQYLAVMTSD